MNRFPVRDFCRVAFPFRGGEGTIAMLAAYFDDSGTHAGSKMTVWAGVIGTVEQFAKLECDWNKMLSEPLPGKSAIRKFSVGDCANGTGEFIDYNYGERDALRYDVRKIIADSGVLPVAYSVPVDLWYQILHGRPLRAYGKPDSLAFASCADLALQISAREQLPLACVFDKGQECDRLNFYIRDAERRAGEEGATVSYSFAPVLGMPGLQAADTIATEHYWYSLEVLQNREAKMQPHFASLVKLTGPNAYIMLKPELENIRREFFERFPLKSWLQNSRLRGIWETFKR